MNMRRRELEDSKKEQKFKKKTVKLLELLNNIWNKQYTGWYEQQIRCHRRKISALENIVIEWSTEGIRPEGGRKNIWRNNDQEIF